MTMATGWEPSACLKIEEFTQSTPVAQLTMGFFS